MCESTYIVLHMNLHIVWTKTLSCGCFFYAKVQRPVWGRPESVAQRKKLLPALSAPLSLSRGLPLPQRGVKLTVTVISRFVGRTVSVPRLGQPVSCSSPFLASLLFCEGYASHTTGDERTILNRISTLKWNHPPFVLAEMTALCFAVMI